MKWVFTALVCLAFASSANGQSNYAHKWLDTSSIDQWFKIKIIDESIYRITYNTLDSILSDAGFDISTIAGDKYNIYHAGEIIPIYVGNNSGPAYNPLKSTDFIEFYATQNTGEFDGGLYKLPHWQLHDYESMFNDTAAYYLTWEQQGDTNFRYSKIVNNLTGALPPVETYYMQRIVHVDNYNYSYTQWAYNFGVPDTIIGPTWLSEFGDGEGRVGSRIPTINQKNYVEYPNIFTTHVDTSGPDAKFTIKLVGKSRSSGYKPDHFFKVFVNGTEILDAFFHDYTSFDTTVSFDAKLLQFNNKIKVECVQSNGANSIAVSYFVIRYPRPYNYNNYSKYSFNTKEELVDKYLEVVNFKNKFTKPLIFDVTNKMRIEGFWNSGLSAWQYLLPTAGKSNGERKLFITSQSSQDIIHLYSKEIEHKNFVNFRDVSNQAPFIILTHPSLTKGTTNWIEEYKMYKDATGDTAVIVMIDELYDQFSYGITNHPLAVRNFVNFAKDKWQIKPLNLFIIGFAVTNGEKFDYKYGPHGKISLIPTYGTPPSDLLLAVKDNFTFTPRLGVGRLAATTPNDVRIYLEKVIEHTKARNNPLATLDEKQWMKQVLHFGGGGHSDEQAKFKKYLNSFKTIIEDTLFGGNVISFFKTSSDPIEHVYSDYLDSLINNGVTLMTFFGHSATNSFDFSVDIPENYENFGKYPLVISNGCYSGNIFITKPNISTRFVLAENKGAIGFLSTSGLGYPTALNRFTSNFYRNISSRYYGKSVGRAITEVCRGIESSGKYEVFDVLTCETFIYHGDPSIVLNTHNKPDYYIADDQLTSNPIIVDVSDISFDIEATITNIGYATNKDLYIQIDRKVDGKWVPLKDTTIDATFYKDYLKFTIKDEQDLRMGRHEFRVALDLNTKIKEISETNNEAIIVVYILSDDLIPVFPYEFSIVPSVDSMRLIASTANAFADVKDYVMQIDTTEQFNSPLLQVKKVTQRGGLVKWFDPPIQWIDGTVYYWRTTALVPKQINIDPDQDVDNNWRYSSFIYLKNGSKGWNQSHVYQYLKDDLNNIEIPLYNQQFKFVDDKKFIELTNFNMHLYPYSSPDAIMYRLNGNKSSSITCLQYGDPFVPKWPSAGLTIAVFDTIAGQPMPSQLAVFPYGTHGELHWCGNPSGEYGAFYWRDSSLNNSAATQIWRDKIKKFMDTIPDGYYVLVYTVCSALGPFPESWENDLYLKFENMLGSTMIRNIQNREPWGLFGKKGSPNWAGKVEMRAGSVTDGIQLKATFSGTWTSGDLVSTPIGPAGKWDSFSWDHHANGNAVGDEISIDIIGIDEYGTENLLIAKLTELDTSLKDISARDYPYIKLICRIKDDSLRSARQVDFLRVNYEPLPEAALNPAALYELSSDTLAEGADFILKLAVENISEYDMDSILIDFVHSGTGDRSGDKFDYPRQAPLKKWQDLDIDFSYNTYEYDGRNVMFIELNPNNDQLEQYHFNNIGFIEYVVAADKANPLLDVTFDGIHIIDGDLVSAKPYIEIQLKDENEFLALDDTSLISMFLYYPGDDNAHHIFFDSQWVNFYPAGEDLSKKNVARVEISLDLTAEDGVYELQVRATDRSSNSSGKYDYKITFEVVNKPMVTNIYNYPNPFTSSTRFVFEITGYQPPTYMKIQIMTVTGKVVRELTLAELGPLRVGQNITDYAWDGTDQYGDPLANGVYLYRVITRLNGELLEHRISAGDDMFTTTDDTRFVGNIGKMVLIR
ncbi:MAG: hypothetical protein IIA45_09445 [Bacteroidetes bacterium]|nr:hypothetical protein [Bacteroidota bacterium]